MAMGKAPQKRKQATVDVSLDITTDQRSAGVAAGQSHCQASRSLLTEVEQVKRFSQSTPSSSAQGPPKRHDKATALARTVFSPLCHLAGPLASLLIVCIFTVYLHTFMTEQTPKLQLLQGKVAQLEVEMRTLKKEVKQAMLELASEIYMRSDWALKSSGATIDMQRTSKTYEWEDNWVGRVLFFFHTPNPPDTILQPDVSPGNCWPFQGHQGQVVIRLSARVHLTAVSVQHIYKEVSPSGTVSSAPRDIAVFGLNADREEETPLGVFVYNVAEGSIQTFRLKNTDGAFSHIKLIVKSNWGHAAYTCIYRVHVHGKMAEPENPN